MAFNNRIFAATLIVIVLVINTLHATYPERDEIEWSRAICRQPKVVGVCKASLLRYRYNPATRKCEEFIYGGCGGNANNFEVEEDCVTFCKDY